MEYLPLLDNTSEILLNDNCQIVYSDVDENNLKWKYGIYGVYGYGTRWEIMNVNNKFVN